MFTEQKLKNIETKQEIACNNPTKPYDVGSQKNHLTETIILSTNNIEIED